MKKFYLTLFLASLLGPLTLFAQLEQAPKVLLQSGERQFPANLASFIAAPDTFGEVVDGRYYRLLQFASAPTAADQERVEQQGIKLLDYVPYHTFWASIPADLPLNKLQGLNLRSVMRPNGLDRLSRHLAEGNFPDWALRGSNSIELVLRFFPDQSRSKVLNQLATIQGVEVISQLMDEPQISVLAPLDKLYDLVAQPAVAWVEAAPEPGQPEDDLGRSLHRANKLYSDHPLGNKYDGSGIKIMVRDDGDVGPHIDFRGRIVNFASSGSGTHGDGVAGVFAGAGNLDPTTRGGATGSEVYVLNYQSTFTDNTLPLHISDTVLITNSSYSNGCNVGYTLTTQRVDEQTYDHPTLLHHFSAGNSNNNDCGYGAGNQWGNITGGHKMGKNVIATANLFSDGSLVNSSSRGPANDGRIKPDIAAHGQGQISTDPNNTYGAFGGTSAASPSNAGVLAQLYQAHKDLYGSIPESPLIKAVALNTAEDLGNPGPDYKYGWGLINGHRALKTLEDGRYLDDTITQNDSNSHSITVPSGVKQMRVMVYWLDPEGSTTASIALVNNLDMKVLSPSAGTFLPLVLNPAPNPVTLDAPAVPGVDNLNNVEQVRIDNPAAGTYTVRVKGTSVPQGPQKYYMLYEFIMDEIEVTYPAGGEGFVPGTTERIHWDAYGTAGTFILEYSTDNGSTWNAIGSTSGSQRMYDWTVPSFMTGQVLVRVSRNGISGQSPLPFTIAAVPQNLNITQICAGYTKLTWNPVPGATGYDVFMLGQKFMDSVGTTTLTNFDVQGTNLNQVNWFSVRARGANGAVGRRAIAINSPTGLLNCSYNTDAELAELISPRGSIPTCGGVPLSVQVKIQNSGIQSIQQIPVGYQVDNNPVVTDTYIPQLNSGTSNNFTFSTPLGITGPGTYTLKVWTAMPGDPNAFNDTVTATFILLSPQAVTLPYNQNFEAYGTCGTSSDCESTICTLGSGWVNDINQVSDDIDWRVDAGGTPSNNTGPSSDHNPGTSSGKYLYTEASNGCSGKTAALITPCLDLTTAQAPEANFWYHMEGGDMGSLHVDLFDGTTWILDIVTPVSGNQGGNWNQMQIPLVNYTGQIIALRIRGVTGPSWQSDIAIDDFSALDVATPPVADFQASQTQVCVNSPVAFQGLTSNNTTGWSWTFSPNTVSFVNGTSTSQNPTVSFSALGQYTVSLTATNPFGSVTETKTNYITVSNGALLNVAENFNNPGLPPANWFLENPDGATTWAQNFVTNIDGQVSRAVFVENFTYNDPGQEDVLGTLPLDLTTAVLPKLYFDVAYARYNATYSDGLRIELSNDCGATYTQTIYNQSGTNLATVPDQSSAFTPNSASQWRRDSIDLTNYVGSTVVIKFINVTGWGNNLYLDNIQIQEKGQVPPNANFIPSATNLCPGDQVVFTQNSSGTGLSFTWDFGPGATPATATGPGPHSVQYSTGGLKDVSLIASNSLGTDTALNQITVDPLPVSGFSFNSANGNLVDFTDASQNATAYLWDFGDGGTSTQASPSHQYINNGSYTVTLIVSNNCGADTLIQTLSVTGIAAPQAGINAGTSSICDGGVITFNDQSSGLGITSYDWNFGAGATPAAATGPGPHTVTYSGVSQSDVQLVVTNGTGPDTANFQVDVDPLPVADFAATLTASLTFSFSNNSTDATSYSWDFGDGNTSTVANPVHVYAASGSYPVQLISQNSCGSDTVINIVDATFANSLEEFDGMTLKLYPNPSHGEVSLLLTDGKAGKYQILVSDMAGKLIWGTTIDHLGNEQKVPLSISELAEGVYILTISREGREKSLRLIRN